MTDTERTPAVRPQAGTLERPAVTFTGLAGRWLASLGTENTRQAYRRDLTDFVGWCADKGGDPLDAERAALDVYRLDLEQRGLRPSTVARRLSALSSFYRYALDAGAISTAPTERVRRPRVDNESPRLGLDTDEARNLLAVAEAHGPRDYALACLLLLNGLRVSEAVALDAGDLETERGHHVVRIHGKGGKVRVAPLSPQTVAAVTAALEGREAGPVLTDTEGRQLNRAQAARIVQRLCFRAGIPKRVSPHSLRHSFVTLALEAGVPIHVVQDAAGHASPETTRRYDRARHALDGHATYTLSVHLSGAAA